MQNDRRERASTVPRCAPWYVWPFLGMLYLFIAIGAFTIIRNALRNV